MRNVGSLIVTTPTDTQIVMKRVFDAPRNLVWNALSQPELIKRWLFGPPGWEMTECEDDLRVGGAFRWAWRGPDGTEMLMRGTYREVTPPQRIVRTESFEFGCAAQAGEQLACVELSEASKGKTHLVLTIEYPNKESRDATIASGMENGVAAGYDRLNEMLQEAATV